MAHVEGYGFAIYRFQEGLPAALPEIVQVVNEPFSLEAGTDKQLSLNIDENLTFYLRMLRKDGLRQGLQDMYDVYFWGSVKYVDSLGTARNISVLRHYENKTERFRAVDDPDYEYAD